MATDAFNIGQNTSLLCTRDFVEDSHVFAHGTIALCVSNLMVHQSRPGSSKRHESLPSYPAERADAVELPSIT